MVGRLFGLDPAPAHRCRVLELGCGDGTNVLSMAQILPRSTFVGVDASAAAIERGEKLAEAAALTNVHLRAAQIEALPADLGGFDYIICHGVYSWISPEARGALLDCCGERLGPDGIAYVSYNAYPGSRLRDMTREVLRYHVRDIVEPDARLEQAHRLMQTIVAIDEPSPYARVLREQMERMLNYSDALLFHDDLAEISTPFYFHEFVEHAAAHGLQFLSEADLSESRMEGVPASAGELFEAIADDPLAREQYMDFFKNRTFRRTLLCRAQASVRRAIEDVHLERFTISSPARPAPDGDRVEGETFVTPDGYSVTTSDSLVLAALHALAGCWPAALEFSAAVGAINGRDRGAARARKQAPACDLARGLHRARRTPAFNGAAGERQCGRATAGESSGSRAMRRRPARGQLPAACERRPGRGS